jgi:hypothetical protein
MKKAKKKYGTVAEVARAIGLNYYGLTVLRYLRDYHPDLALDYDFIMARASRGAQLEADYALAHGTDGFSQSEARRLSHEVMLGDLEFSEHSIIFGIVDDYYDRTSYSRGSEEVRAVAIELRPQLKSIFAKYPTESLEFAASCEYDEMVAKLTKKAEKLLQEREELPF